ncbi:MAG: hemolysin family protein [Candidatus Dechloromonas phosphoritropha]
MFIEFAAIVIFLLLKGFFSGSEIAMVNSDKIRLRHMAKTGDKGAALVLKMYKTPDLLLGTTLVGTNVATVTVTTLITIIFIEAMGPSGDIISVVLATPFLLILGEIVPKSIYQQKADFMVTRIVFGLRFFAWVFFPVVFVFSRVARFATRLAGGSTPVNSGFISREELRMLLETSSGADDDDGGFDAEKVARITRFSETSVGEVMTPLDEVVGISEHASMEEAVQLVLAHGYNRLPIYRGNMSNIVGILTLNSWDLMATDINRKAKADYIQEPVYVSSRQPIDRTIKTLLLRPIDFMAIVVNEFGSAIGILSMEDIFEEVVGEIDVGYDFDEYESHRSKQRIMIKELGSQEFLVDGRTPISQINEELHLNIPMEAAHTVAGLIINRLRTIPPVGSQIREESYLFTVRAVSARTIIKVHIKRA